MASFNRVILMGNLTRDVELKYTQSGLAVTEIGLAVNDRRKNQQTGEWVDEPVFVDITLWGRTAEIASEYLSKGSPVHIEGRLKLDQWEKEGQKRSKLRVVGESLQMVGSKGGQKPPASGQFHSEHGEEQSFSPPAGQRQTSAGSTPVHAGAGASPPSDDIPF